MMREQATSKQRWQPPSMNKAQAHDARRPSGVKVDEQVVRKILKVNPALRAGRTTGQVKQSLERGEPLVKHETTAAAAAPASTPSPTPLPSYATPSVSFWPAKRAPSRPSATTSMHARRRSTRSSPRLAPACGSRSSAS
jgi:hypothetical protein